MASLPPQAARAQARFCAWLKWYLQEYPDRWPSQAEMARQLDVTPATVSYLLDKGSTQAPNFKTLVNARILFGMNLDVMLFSDPPATK